MRFFHTTLFASLGFTTCAIHAHPTGPPHTIPPRRSEIRDAYNHGSRSGPADISWKWFDNTDCNDTTYSPFDMNYDQPYPLVYPTTREGRQTAFTLSRDLRPGEQLDLSSYGAGGDDPCEVFQALFDSGMGIAGNQCVDVSHYPSPITCGRLWHY